MAWQPSQGPPKTRAEWLEKHQYEQAQAKYPFSTTGPEGTASQAPVADTSVERSRGSGVRKLTGVLLVVAVVAGVVVAGSAVAIIYFLGNNDTPPPTQDQESVSIDLSSVRGVQRGLHELGFNPGPIDGIPGPITQAAVRNYQESRGIEPTGVADGETLTALAEDLRANGFEVRGVE